MKHCRKCKEPLGELETPSGKTGMFQCINSSCPRYGLLDFLPIPKYRNVKRLAPQPNPKQEVSEK